MHTQRPLISVVVPAFNAAPTIKTTLRSAQAQTEHNLEIIVVDDGSTDDTRQLIEAAAADDPRIRIVCQSQGGVAAARNTGIETARGAFIAPLDADDVWAPGKLAKQLQVLAAAPGPIGFVYCLHRIIDIADRVISTPPGWQVDGHGLCRLVMRNFVGNGSALLMPTAVVREIGGYDCGLRRLGLEGAEDWKLQLEIAARYPIRCCPEYLVGYRHHPGRMSDNQLRMLMGQLHVLNEQLQARPEIPPRVAAAARGRLHVFGAPIVLRSTGLGATAALLATSFRQTVWGTTKAAHDLLRRRLNQPSRKHAPEESRPSFAEVPTRMAAVGTLHDPTARREWALLEAADRAMTDSGRRVWPKAPHEETAR